MSQLHPRLLRSICHWFSLTSFTSSTPFTSGFSRHSPLVHPEPFARRATRHFVVAAALLLLSIPCAFGLDPSLDISQYAHTSWKVRDGFTKGAITSLAQTPDGYLWLGTEFGLVRFDGVRAVPWQPPPGAELPSDHITSLFVAKDGTLWIGTWKGLASWRFEKLTAYPELSGLQVASLLQDREGTVWIGATGTPRPGRLCAIRDGKVYCRGEDGIFGIGVFGLHEDQKGNLWLGVANGFWRWKPGASEFFSAPNREPVFGFEEDDRGSLLIASQSGLSRFIDGRVEPYAEPRFAQGFRAAGIFKDQAGCLWVRTLDRGLVHIHDGKADVFSAGDGLSGDFIQAVLEDREGNIWTASAGGLDRFREYSVANLSVKQGLSHNNVLSVLATKDGSVWISTGSGLNRWKDGHVSSYSLRNRIAAPDRGVNGHPAESLFEDHSGRVWISSVREFGHVDNGRLVPVDGIPTGVVYSVAEVGQGHLWISNQQAGLIHVFQGKVVQEIPWAGLDHDDDAFTMAADPSQKGLWLGFSGGGVAYFANGGIQKTYSAAQGLGKGWVTGLRFGPRVALWAATQGGLSRIEGDRVATLTTKNGLPCDSVHWSMEDDDQSVWLYTACGLVRVSRSDIDAWVANPARIVNLTVFDASDGVPSSPLPGAFAQPVTKSSDGKLWFVTQNGVVVINPHNLAENKQPPPVHIEQITADGRVYDASNGVRLPRLVRYVDIDYTALSLVVPEKVRFRVKLEGEDKDWRELVNVRRVSYTNLAPKHYRFLVKACNNSGVWNEEGAALDFVIPPAWYQTYWFLAVCVAAFLALLWALYQYRLHQLAQQFNMRLEERVGERTRIARDLHDTLLQSFHGVLLFLQSGIHLLDEHPAEAKKTLNTAAKQAERAIIEGREAVQGLRASTVERNDLAMAIKTLGGELAAADSNTQRPEFNVQVEGTARNLHPILRDEVYRITGEAMRNAFRHSYAKQIEVEIRYDERQLRVRVRDDGQGIDPKLLSHDGREGHFGLRGMRERAKLIGGKLTVWSELDSGTEVELSIPANRAYTTPADGQRSWLAEKFAKLSGKDTELKS
jgi:signal transduction histidine kinase